MALMRADDVAETWRLARTTPELIFQDIAGVQNTMWRAFFMAVGISCCVLGAECLVTDRFILASEAKPSVNNSFFAAPQKKREFIPPESAPWSLLSVGAIAILYSLALPKPSTGGEGH
jgi:hypothetical protein